MPTALLNCQPPPAVSRPSTRIDALDWTKGALIICMVIYHAINYSAFRPMAFRFLGFLPPSFILITGFLVGQVYAAKYDLETWKPYARLAIRGTKLFLIFTLLNLARCVALEHNFFDGMDEFAALSRTIFLSGNGRVGIFEVLLPIACFLLLAPLLLWFSSRNKAAIAICAVAIFFTCLALEMNGRFSNNLSLLSAGIIGMAFGLVRMESIDRVAMKWIPVLLLYLLYRLCSQIFGERYPVQMLGAAVSVFVLYACALHLNCASWFEQQIIILGKYSLLGYLAQIAVLQGLVKLTRGKPEHVMGVVVLSLLAMVLTFLIIRSVHAFRRRSRPGDMVYKAIFA